MIYLFLSCMGSKIIPLRQDIVYPLRIKTKLELVEWSQTKTGLDFKATVAADCNWSHHFKESYAPAANPRFTALSPMLAPYNPVQHAEDDIENYFLKSLIKGYKINTLGFNDIGCTRDLNDTNHQLTFKMYRDAIIGEAEIQEFIVDVQVTEEDISHPTLNIIINATDTSLNVCSESWNSSSKSKFQLTKSHLDNETIPYADIALQLESYVDCENQLDLSNDTFLTTHAPDKWKMHIEWGDKKEDISLVGSSMVQSQLCQSKRLEAKYNQFLTLIKIGDYRPNHQVEDQARRSTIDHLFTQCSVDQLMPMLCDKEWIGTQIIDRIKEVMRSNETQLSPQLLNLYSEVLISSPTCISDVDMMSNIDFLVHMSIRLRQTEIQPLISQLSNKVMDKLSQRLPESWIKRNKALLMNLPLGNAVP